MEVSLANLLLLINQKSTEVSEWHSEVLKNTILIKDREIDGRETILNKVEDFDFIYSKYKDVCNELSKYKNLLTIKNSTVKIQSGITIIEAINNISILKKRLYLLDDLASKNPKLSRQSDGNGISSYYRVNDLNFDLESIKAERIEVKDEITQLESEIQQTNSTTFIEI